jgi:hypothetical protein
MEYTATKSEGQNLMFHIVADNNGEKVRFNVVCAQSEAEVPDLVVHHLNFLNNPPVISPVQQPTSPDLTSLVQQQQSLIESLTARIAALEGQA